MEELIYVSTGAQRTKYRPQLLDALDIFKWQLLPNMHVIQTSDSISGLYNIMTYQEFIELKGIELEYSFRTLSKRWYLLFSSSDEFIFALKSIEIYKQYTSSKFSEFHSYEVTSKGDRRFSPFFMRVKNPYTKDLMSLEDYYQLILKGYWNQGYRSWKEVKGLPPLTENIKSFDIDVMNSYRSYLSKYKGLLFELALIGQSYIFTDMFMTSNNSQAIIYCSILNNLFNGGTGKEIIS